MNIYNLPWTRASVVLALAAFAAQLLWLDHLIPDPIATAIVLAISAAWAIATLGALWFRRLRGAWTLLLGLIATPSWFLLLIAGACAFAGQCL